MNERIGILHLSDIHACAENKVTIQHLVELLKKDIQTIQHEKNVTIKMACITGDLINSGDNADEELDIVYDAVVQPLMNLLNLDGSHFFIVAGNHEVKRSMINQYIESGLASILVSEAAINDFISKSDDESIKRISYFDRDFTELFSGNMVWQNALGRAFILTIGSLRIGVSCLNSAWRSTGIGMAEKCKLAIGNKQIIDSYESIKDADLKICLVHHPFDWLIDEDKTAIEKCIGHYDIVLNGHIHESNTKLVAFYNGKTLFNTCGKFDNSSDIYNGYSILAINPYNKTCDVIVRQYFNTPRDCYDEALCVAPCGMVSVGLGAKNGDLSVAYNISRSIAAKFIEYANSYFISNVAAGKVVKSFDESFIVPEFRKNSEYKKETEYAYETAADDDIVTLESICKGKQNMLLLGKKEFGKTTILHYIAKYCVTNYNTLISVPVIIDALNISYAGKNVIVRAVCGFINEYCDSSDSFSRKDVEKLLSAGLCTIMFDNFETVGSSELAKINEFINGYPNNRFIFSEKESITANCFRSPEVIPACEYETAHICSLTKNQIRSIATQNFSAEDCSVLVDKIMLCFKRTTLPRTPFVLSLILSICNAEDFSPVNEAVIMEQFMEFLLEKTSPSEACSTTYDFRIKEDFLINLVAHMDDNNKFYLSIDEFDRITRKYHEEKGFTVSATKFDTLFFENGVLIRTDYIVAFRYNCMTEYYLAKRAAQSPDYLKHILTDRNYLNYSKELMYYTGLNRQDSEVVGVLRQDLLNDFKELMGVIPRLEDYNIGLDLSLPEDGFSQRIGQAKLSQTQSDKLQDTEDASERHAPEEIDKTVRHEYIDAFIHTLLIYGNCLKNLELLPKNVKETMYNDYITGLCIMLGLFKENMEEYFRDKLSTMKRLPGEYTDEDICQTEKMMQDMLRISIPVALQNIALENAGTSKLRAIVEGAINNKNYGEFPRFFSVFMFSDLHLRGFQRVLNDYIAEVKNKDLLTIIFAKLLYYYMFRYFSPTCDSFLENTLANINSKLHVGNKIQKDRMIHSLQERRMRIRACFAQGS